MPQGCTDLARESAATPDGPTPPNFESPVDACTQWICAYRVSVVSVRAVTFDVLRASKRQKVTDAPPDTRGFQQVHP